MYPKQLLIYIDFKKRAKYDAGIYVQQGKYLPNVKMLSEVCRICILMLVSGHAVVQLIYNYCEDIAGNQILEKYRK